MRPLRGEAERGKGALWRPLHRRQNQNSKPRYCDCNSSLLSLPHPCLSGSQLDKQRLHTRTILRDGENLVDTADSALHFTSQEQNTGLEDCVLSFISDPNSQHSHTQIFSVTLVLVGFILLGPRVYKLLSVTTSPSFIKDRVICHLLRLHTRLLGVLVTFLGPD